MKFSNFPKRVSRTGGAVHAARHAAGSIFRTACGRLMSKVNHHPTDHAVSCAKCLESNRQTDVERLQRLQEDVERLQDRVLELDAAAKPFVEFIDKYDAKPLGNIADDFYSIHSGEDGASLRLSDLRRLRAATRS